MRGATTKLTRSVSEGECFKRFRIHRVVKRSPSLTLRVSVSVPCESSYQNKILNVYRAECAEKSLRRNS